jgi:hypothetical protein
MPFWNFTSGLFRVTISIILHRTLACACLVNPKHTGTCTAAKVVVEGDPKVKGGQVALHCHAIWCQDFASLRGAA